MKAKLKSISILFVICLLFSQLCACSSLNASDQLSDNVSVSTISKQTKKTKKKATKPATTEVVTVIIEEVLVEEEEEEETPTATIPPVEEDDYEEEEEGLTQSEIDEIYQRISNEYESAFQKYEREYKEKRAELKKQQGELTSECSFKLEMLRVQMANSGMLDSGYYKTQSNAIKSSYDQQIQQIGNEITQLDNEYTAVKNGLQAAIDEEVLEEIYRIENGY